MGYVSWRPIHSVCFYRNYRGIFRDYIQEDNFWEWLTSYQFTHIYALTDKRLVCGLRIIHPANIISLQNLDHWYYLMAVVLCPEFAWHVNPERALGVALPDELVEGCVVHNPSHPFLSLLHRRYSDVACLATHVLACGAAAHGWVEPRATIAAWDDYGLCHEHAQGFENLCAEVGDAGD